MDDDFQIIPIHGHYEVYHKGTFYCSADTYHEAEQEINSTNLMESVI